MAVSKKDLARVNLGKKRQEKIKVQALTKWKAKVPVGTTIYNHGQEKPAVVYTDKDVIRSDDCKMRSSADKVARQLKLDGGDKFVRDGYDHPSYVIKGTTSGRGSRKGK